jgi:hypothetical protein
LNTGGRLRQAEFAEGAGREDEVAGERQHEPAAERVTVDRRDDGQRHAEERPDRRVDRPDPVGALAGVGGSSRLRVDPGGEAGAGARQDDRRSSRLGFARDRILQLAQEVDPERVDRRAREAQQGATVSLFALDELHQLATVVAGPVVLRAACAVGASSFADAG